MTGKLTRIKKNEFEWTPEHTRHFEAIRRAVLGAKILRHPDLHRPFFVQTDASATALGAVLLHDFGGKYLEPIEFISRKPGKDNYIADFLDQSDADHYSTGAHFFDQEALPALSG